MGLKARWMGLGIAAAPPGGRLLAWLGGSVKSRHAGGIRRNAHDPNAPTI
jgi:hypothetical protein